MTRWLGMMGACAALLVAAPMGASAQDGGGGFPILLSGGLKAGGGGNYLGEPSNRPAVSLPFDDGAGGWGAGVGPYVQGAILDGLLSLELGLIVDWGYNWSQYTLGQTDYELGWDFTTMRIPIMFEVGTPGEGTRLSLGTGPELAVGMGAKGKVDGANMSQRFPATGEGGTHWAFNLGIEAPFKMLRLSFDVHYTLNLDSVKDYRERVAFVGNSGIPVSVLAKHDMDLRLLLGVAYDYELSL